MKILSDRIQWLMTNRNLTNADLCKAAGVKASSVSAWLDGKSKGLRADVALRLSKSLGISIEWLVEGTGLPDQEDIEIIDKTPKMSQIKIPEVGLTFQNGSVQWCTIPDGEPMFYTPEEFAELEAESPKTCKCLRVKDDSMRPILFKGDRIVFDIAQTDIVQGGVYVLAIDNEYLIRRLFKKLSGVILIKTFDAELIGDEELDEKTFSERMQIKGRVIAKKGSGGLK